MKSMTGYSSLELLEGKNKYSIEMKSVNNRYFDINIRLPKYLYQYEFEIKKMISKVISRGKIDLFIDVKQNERNININIDNNLAVKYSDAYNKIKKITKSQSNVPLALVINSEGVMTTENTINKKSIWLILKKMIKEILDKFEDMRIHEGLTTKKNISSILKNMIQNLRFIKSKTKNSLDKNFAFYKQKIKKLVTENYDENLVITEAGLLASKTDINEEISRLESHFDLFKKNLEDKKPIGRTLDFVCQEMNREINTIGSKISDFNMSEKVIILKSGLEKIREQIRNIE